MTREEFEARWVAQRDTFKGSGALVDGARLIDLLLTELATVDEVESMRALSLRDAASITGYSAEHLGRLIRTGALPNAGRKGAPRIRLADLPAPREFARNRSRSYDVNADARTLRNGRQ